MSYAEISTVKKPAPRVSSPLTWEKRHTRRSILHVDQQQDDRLAFESSVARTLEQSPRSLHCQYLYDQQGSALFEAITEQPEYYQTRTEDQILAHHADTIRASTGPCTLAELGSGSSSKTLRLLDAWTRCDPASVYVPLDISCSALEQACELLGRRYPELVIEALASTYERGLPLLSRFSPITLTFLGSSIGNFNEAELDRFLEMIAVNLQPGDHFLLGIDLVKPAAELEAAYNDRAGVTEAFTRNLFTRMNRELGTQIDPRQVRHVAFYNQRLQRIEIYAEFLEETFIELRTLKRHFRIARGERVLTEISRKFHVDEMAANAGRFGLHAVGTWLDEGQKMAVMLFRRSASAGRINDQRTSWLGTLQRVRSRTLDIIAPLSEAALTEQPHALHSPIVWDLGHIANFESRWLDRALVYSLAHPCAPVDPSQHAEDDTDALYDPALTPRAERGNLALPNLEDTLATLRRVRSISHRHLRDLALLPSHPLTRQGFVVHMVAQHEAQHQETILQSLQLGTREPYRPAFATPVPQRPDDVALDDMARVPAGWFFMGTRDEIHAYDNERPMHRLFVDSFLMDTTPVTNGAYAEFIAAGGYQEESLWSAEGLAWLHSAGVSAPLHWVKQAGYWQVCHFGRLSPMDPERPVIHVNAFEAEAFARWQGKRLPTEAEWEKAACWDGARHTRRTYPWGEQAPASYHANLDQTLLEPVAVGSYPEGRSFYGCHQMIGDVWEWTASVFTPYPGFEAFPYPEYSADFFDGRYRVLKGGSWATSSMVARGSFRNWDFPVRRQIFAGFRCARDAD